jgi:calcineurin-like phosphoesterase family protein
MYSHITYIKRFLVITGSLFVFLPGCTPTQQPLKVAMVADCQYCDCDYSERWDNDYRAGKTRLIAAIDTLNKEGIDLGFHLGDLIDRDMRSYATLFPILKSAGFPFHHVLGNHDFKVAPEHKSSVLPMLNLRNGYYSMVRNNYRFIVLDGTEVSNYRYADSSRAAQADKIMELYAKDNRPQAKPWNGGMSNQQLNWLQQQLDSCTTLKQNAIIMCHFPVSPAGDANLWNDKEVVDLISKYDVVKLFINGHHHPGNYTETNGIPFVTMHALVSTQQTTSFGYLNLFDRKIELIGFGRELSRTWEW